ncbi:hypothetical protein GCM10023166_27830 [Paeniglutamicibacter cryotolerans]|uniref:DUF2804 domain-containing protein n=1 Tax=Paeniglutamicibacter cryotolerans TaxID=670079 RepID=A0A839QGW4_9MICC|nr:hypothetical protein [Paeniglutamicibacter cryotolerans]
MGGSIPGPWASPGDRCIQAPPLPAGIGHGWRTKRWKYWGISTDGFVLGLAIAHLA